jgi:hypothetical protein
MRMNAPFAYAVLLDGSFARSGRVQRNAIITQMG